MIRVKYEISLQSNDHIDEKQLRKALSVIAKVKRLKFISVKTINSDGSYIEDRSK